MEISKSEAESTLSNGNCKHVGFESVSSKRPGRLGEDENECNENRCYELQV